MDKIEYHKQLPESFRKQIAEIARLYHGDKDVTKCFHELVAKMKEEGTYSEQYNETLLHMSTLKTIKASTLIHPRWFHIIRCYNSNGHEIVLKKIIKDHKKSRVMLGEYTTVNNGKSFVNEVVVKWYSSRKHGDITKELKIYKMLDKLNCNTPKFNGEYKLWNHNVLVIEKLHHVNALDNECILGAHIVEQLKCFHRFAVHSDIKIDNLIYP